MRSIPLRCWFLVVLSAVLQAVPFPFAGPVGPLRRAFCWICLVPLLLCLGRRIGGDEGNKPLRLRQGALLGYLCGVLWYLATCYWIYATMHLYGGLPGWAAASVLLLFALYLGLYHALFAASFTFLAARVSGFAALLAAPFLWTAVELLRGRVTGFPWDLMGYTQVDHLSLNQVASVTGTLGLSLLVAAINAAWLIPLLRSDRSRRRFLWPGLALVLLLGMEAAGALWKPAPEAAARTAVLVQDNLSVGPGVVRESKDQLIGSLSRWSLHPVTGMPGATADAEAFDPARLRGAPDVIAWAEAPANFFSADPEFRQAAGLLAREAHAPLIADTASAEYAHSPGGQPREFASAAFFTPQGEYAGRYDKMHLVPFGEYVPYKPLFFFAGHLLDGLDFSPGTQRRTLTSGGHTFGVFICYESIFGTEVREFAKMGAQVFVNLSDDGWYGDTSAPWEHLDMVRMRAVENHRWVLRATNTGITASIDTHGRVVARLPRHVRAALAAPFAYENGTTFYTRHGDWPGWVCLAVSVGVLGFAWWRPTQVVHVSASAKPDTIN